MNVKSKRTNINAYKKFVKIFTDGREIWTKAFEEALKTQAEIYIPNGKYYIDKSLIIKSNTSIIAEDNAEICLVKGVKTLLLRNEDVVNGSYVDIGTDRKCTQNISIIGGIWSEENQKRLGYGKSGAYDENDSMRGVTTCMLFSGVKNLTLKNLTFRNTAAFAIQIGRTENFTVENVKFENCFADGVHVNGHVKNGLIKNVYGETGDDLVALNVYDWDNSTINNGPMENVVVDGVYPAESKGYKAFRIQPGVVPIANGEQIDCYIKGLTIKHVYGISVFKVYLQTPEYKDKPDGTKVGRIEDISFEDVEVEVNSPVDQMENYRLCDEITGHFGAFEIGSNIKNISLKNVKAKLNVKDYPTCHLITVGPKSAYLKDLGIELFDPYVKCEVENLIYESVYVNGEKVEDIKTYVHQTSFNKLYPNCIGDGCGELINVEKK